MESLSGGEPRDEHKLTNHNLFRLGIRRVLVMEVIEINVNLFVGAVEMSEVKGVLRDRPSSVG
jgi:hypothetical protein